jgi:hypothetical protein
MSSHYNCCGDGGKSTATAKRRASISSEKDLFLSNHVIKMEETNKEIKERRTEKAHF